MENQVNLNAELGSQKSKLNPNLIWVQNNRVNPTYTEKTTASHP